MKKNKGRKIVNKKHKIILIFSLVILSVIFFAYYYFYILKKGINYKSKLVIEVGESLPKISDYVSDNDLDKVGKEIIWKDLEIVDGNVYNSGEYDGVISYKDNNIKIKLIVKDTTKPVISGVHDFVMLEYEKEPDFLGEITVTDNSNEKLVPTIVGEYDIEKKGEYTLYYLVKDSSGNETKTKFKLIVKDNPNIITNKTSKDYTIKTYYGVTHINNIIIVNKTYSLPSNYVPNNLVTINGYIKVIDYVKDAFNELKSDAGSIGLNIYASSGYRSYNDQNYIYNNYVKIDGQEKADTYSARAGYSEHQTGLAIDLNSIDMSFDNTDESSWLKDNCYRYGFIIRYPNGKDSITGYMYEPWHIRYVGKELASKLYNDGEWITLEEYYGIDSKYR